MISEMKYFNDKYVYFNEVHECWRIKDNVPDDIRQKLQAFLDEHKLEDGIVTLY